MLAGIVDCSNDLQVRIFDTTGDVTNDGTSIVFTDEWGGGGAPKCRASDPPEWGANAIFTIEGTDMAAAAAGHVSITPLRLAQLSAAVDDDLRGRLERP